MKKLLCVLLAFAISACTHLTKQEQDDLHLLKMRGIDIDHAGSFDRPANPAVAGVLNILPGFGNFYLAAGNGGDSAHWLYGALNLLTWPLSIVWGIPEAAIDANKINQREMIYYYKYPSTPSFTMPYTRY